MSILVMSNVWRLSKSNGNALLTLLAIADCANDDGVAFPGLSHLAHKVRVSRTTIIKYVDKLVGDGELYVHAKQGRSHRYFVNVGFDKQFAATMIAKIEYQRGKNEYVSGKEYLTSKGGFTGIDGLTTTGIDGLTGVVNPVLPDPSLNRKSNHHKDSAKSTARKKKERDPNLDHPAFKAWDAFRSSSGPNKLAANAEQRTAIVETVGDDEDAIKAWMIVIEHWMLRGYLLKTVDGLLDWFRKWRKAGYSDAYRPWLRNVDTTQRNVERNKSEMTPEQREAHERYLASRAARQQD